VDIDITFIGVDGIDIVNGVTAAHPDEAAVNAAMVREARQSIVVADHTKLGKSAVSCICPLQDLDLIITDTGASDEDIAPFLKKKVAVSRS